MESSKTKKETGKPGRPRKNPEIEKPVIRGILPAPSNHHNTIEFVSQLPNVFKRLATYFSAVGTKDIAFMFKKDSVEIHTVDHFENVHIRAVFDCKSTVSYYCAEPAVYFIKSLAYEKEFRHLDNSIPTVSFSVKAGEHVMDLCVETQVMPLGVIKTTAIHISASMNASIMNSISTLPTFNDYSYQCQLETKALKKQLIIFDRKKTMFSFRKYGHQSLSIVPMIENTELSAFVFSDEQKIIARFNLHEEDILNLVVAADSIQPILSSQLADNLTFNIDFERPMVVQFGNEFCYCNFYVKCRSLSQKYEQETHTHPHNTPQL